MTICERFFWLLNSKGKKAADLCRILNIGTSVTTGWKNRNTDPPAKYIMPICDFLDVSPEYLLTGADPVTGESEFEIELLRMYRNLPSSMQDFIYDSVKAAYDKELTRKEASSGLSGKSKIS